MHDFIEEGMILAGSDEIARHRRCPVPITPAGTAARPTPWAAHMATPPRRALFDGLDHSRPQVARI